MVNDQEPRYRLVDADGNVVGSLFAESDGTLKLQEGTSGNDNELALNSQGVLGVEQIEGDRLISGGFAGTTADARLSNAITVADTGDVIVLESADYTTDRTFSKKISLVGAGGLFDEYTTVKASWTLNPRMELRHIAFSDSLEIEKRCRLFHCGAYGDSWTVVGDAVQLIGPVGLADTITFQSGTSNGIVDGGVDVSVTDNGSNTVGDLG